MCPPPINSDAIQFIEENSLAIIKALSPNELYTFMSKMFKPDISPSNYSFPYYISLFFETLQAIFSVLSQILGLEDDKTITEIMLGIVCLISQFAKEFNLSFD